MTLEVLICSFNKGIVKVEDVLCEPRDGVRYIVSFQYTDERYLEMIPKSLTDRPDVRLFKYRGQGLSSNRNQALTHAKADIVMYADDDTRLKADTFDAITAIFEKHPDVDVALFCASTYTGRLLKEYPAEEQDVASVPSDYHVSTVEMAFRRERIQGVVRYDERFGLGTRFLTCGEEDIWLFDVLKHDMKVRFFPECLVETSAMMKHTMIYVDAGVQRSYGAYLYYSRGHMAWLQCLRFAARYTLRGYCHFVPTLRHLWQGAWYVRKTN